MADPLHLAALHYSYVDDMLKRRAPHRDAHLDLVADWVSDGRLVIAGALGDPPHGAFFAFCDTATADAFVDADPYAAAGLVTSRRIEPWTVVAHGPLPG